jgi:hypothetical protein
LALSADSAIFEKYILFGSGFKSDGCAWLRAAHITGDLDVAGANFSNPNRIAMNLAYAKIGTLHFYNGAKINGQIRLVAATIDTSLCWEDLEQPKLTIWDLSHAKVNPLAAQRQNWHSRQPAHVWLSFNELAEPAAPLARTQLSWLRAKNRPRRFAFRPARAEQCGCGKTRQLRRRPTGAYSAVASPTPPALPVQPGR